MAAPKYIRILDGIIDGKYSTFAAMCCEEFANATYPNAAAKRLLEKAVKRAGLYLLSLQSEAACKDPLRELFDEFSRCAVAQESAEDYAFLFLRHNAVTIKAGREQYHSQRQATDIELAWNERLFPMTPTDVIRVLCEILELGVMNDSRLESLVRECFELDVENKRREAAQSYFPSNFGPDWFVKNTYKNTSYRPKAVSTELFKEADILPIANLIEAHWAQVKQKRRPFYHIDNGNVRRINDWFASMSQSTGQV